MTRTQEQVKADIVEAWKRLFELAEESKALMNPTESELEEGCLMTLEGRHECGGEVDLGYAGDLLDVLDEIECIRERVAQEEAGPQE